MSQLSFIKYLHSTLGFDCAAIPSCELNSLLVYIWAVSFRGNLVKVNNWNYLFDFTTS